MGKPQRRREQGQRDAGQTGSGLDQARESLRLIRGPSRSIILSQRSPRGWFKETYCFLQRKWVCEAIGVRTKCCLSVPEVAAPGKLVAEGFVALQANLGQAITFRSHSTPGTWAKRTLRAHLSRARATVHAIQVVPYSRWVLPQIQGFGRG